MGTANDHPLVVTVTAPDGTGLVAAIAGAVASAEGNILDVGQHSDVDSSWFGCRLEIDPSVKRPELENALQTLVATRGASWQLHSAEERPRVVVLCSKALHCVSDLLARFALDELRCELVGVVSDYDTAADLVARHDAPFFHLPTTEDRTIQEQQLGTLLEELQPDLVVLARYMRILPADITERWSGKMINIHHSFLPAFPGANPYARAHERGVKLIGATAHYVIADLDEGPIIAQSVERVTHRDSIDDLVRRGADVERVVLAQAVRLHLEHRLMIFSDRTCIFD